MFVLGSWVIFTSVPVPYLDKKNLSLLFVCEPVKINTNLELDRGFISIFYFIEYS